MRRLSLLAILAAPLTAVSAAPVPERPAPQADQGLQAPPSAPACRIPKVAFAGQDRTAARVQKLGEQPPANQYLAVDRRVGDCLEPAIVRTGIGG
jgi:hypothetical protein